MHKHKINLRAQIDPHIFPITLNYEALAEPRGVYMTEKMLAKPGIAKAQWG